jgi:hypothetical protein
VAEVLSFLNGIDGGIVGWYDGGMFNLLELENALLCV